MFGGGPPGVPPMPQMQLGKGKKGKKELPKLIDDNNGKNLLKLAVNRGYQLYYIVTNFCKSAMWFTTCFSFMYLLPMAIEYMQEQNRIMMKI